MANSIKKLSIKSPKRYKIALAIAKGLNERKQLKEIFASLGINHNTGYAVASQLKNVIAEMRVLQAGSDEKSSAVLQAKELLKEASPELAQVVIDIAKDQKQSARERVAAAKAGLQLAGIDEAAPQPPAIGNIMRDVVMNIFYNEPMGEEAKKMVQGDQGQPVIEAEVKGEEAEDNLRG